MEFDSDTKIWSGAKEDRNGDNLSFRETVLDAIRSTPEKVFQISDDEDTTLTYAETAAISIRIAQNLKRFGVQSNDVVAVLVNNSTYLAPIVIGCVMIGAPVNSVMSKTGVDVSSIKGVFDVTKPKVVIIEECEKFYNHVTEAVRTSELNCKIFVMNSDHQNLKENVFNFSELLMKADNEDNFEWGWEIINFVFTFNLYFLLKQIVSEWWHWRQFYGVHCAIVWYDWNPKVNFIKWSLLQEPEICLVRQESSKL